MDYHVQHIPPPHHHHHHHHRQIIRRPMSPPPQPPQHGLLPPAHPSPYHHQFQQHQQPYHLHRVTSGASSGVEVASGRWSVTSEITTLTSIRVAAPATSLTPSGLGSAGVRSLSVVQGGGEYIRCVNARGVQRLVRRKPQGGGGGGGGALPPATIRGVGAKIHQRRGLSRTPLDEPNIDSISDNEIFSRSYVATIQKAYESQQITPCSSGRSSPTITETQSPLSISHGGWTTGNTTERSSLDSSYSLDDFDKQTANTVHQHFEDIESMLFEGPKETMMSQADLGRECKEWSSQFPHLRVLGKQACPPKDMGYQQVLPDPQITPRPASSSIILDHTDHHDLSLSSTDSQGLSISGRSVSATLAPVHSLSSSMRDTSASTYSFLLEEVIEEDGIYEEVIAVDYKNIYEDNLEYKKQITPRRRRVGYPPITPNACVKDSVTSGAFDHIWQEVMSWMRQLLKKYTSEVTDCKNEVISFSPNSNQATPISREFSFMTAPRQFSFQRSQTHLGNTTDRSIDGILQITSMSLQNRNQMMEPSESQVLTTVRPGSSFHSSSHLRPMSHLRSQRGARGGQLAPLVGRSKTPNTEDQRSSHQAATDALRVRRLTPMSNNDSLPSPPANFQRNGALPPLEMERTQRKLQGYRATSAIDNKDMRMLTFRDRYHNAAEQARPNTTHAMRSETPLGGSQNRRSSTPLGNSINARNAQISNKALDVRGNSLQYSADTSHFHPDILEDQQEGPVEEVIRTHWNPPHASNNPHRRSHRLTLKN